jgi:cold shock protein
MGRVVPPKASVSGCEVQTGIIKWFNRRGGFVLIGPDNGCTDVLLHVTSIEGAAPEELQTGRRVQFETVTKTEKPEIADRDAEIAELRHGTFHAWPR